MRSAGVFILVSPNAIDALSTSMWWGKPFVHFSSKKLRREASLSRQVGSIEWHRVKSDREETLNVSSTVWESRFRIPWRWPSSDNDANGSLVVNGASIGRIGTVGSNWKRRSTRSEWCSWRMRQRARTTTALPRKNKPVHNESISPSISNRNDEER